MKNKIFVICDDLQKNGIKPTLEKVRQALGGGSFSTINPILKDWKDQQASNEQINLELPSEAVQAINQATMIIWKLAADKNTELTNAIKHEFDILLNEATAEKEEALGEVSQLEKTVSKLTADNDRQAKEINGLTLQVQKQQLALDADVKQIEELKAELKTLRAELKQADNEAAMLAGKLSVYEQDKLNKPVTRKKTATTTGQTNQ